jgi:hypothetical protein
LKNSYDHFNLRGVRYPKRDHDILGQSFLLIAPLH